MTYDQAKNFRVRSGPYARMTLAQVANSSAGLGYLDRAGSNEFLREHHRGFHAAVLAYLDGIEAARAAEPRPASRPAES